MDRQTLGRDGPARPYLGAFCPEPGGHPLLPRLSHLSPGNGGHLLLLFKGGPGEELHPVRDRGRASAEHLSGGSLFGEASFLDELPRVSSAVALTPCQLVPIDRELVTQGHQPGPGAGPGHDEIPGPHRAAAVSPGGPDGLPPRPVAGGPLSPLPG